MRIPLRHHPLRDEDVDALDAMSTVGRRNRFHPILETGAPVRYDFLRDTLFDGYPAPRKKKKALASVTDLVCAPAMLDFYKTLHPEANHFGFCHVNHFLEGHHLGKHKDIDYIPGLSLTLILHLSKSRYDGGEFIFYDRGRKPHMRKSGYGDLIALYTDVPHRVRLLRSGERRILVYGFVRDKRGL